MSPASPHLDPPENPSDPRAAPRHIVPAWARVLTHWLDEAFTIPGTKVRLGLEAIVGFLLPGVGDTLGALTSFSIVVLAVRRGVPGVIVARMVLNVAVDAVLGAVPLVGDVFDVAFRANRKNLTLIERYAGAFRPAPRWVDYALVGGAAVAAISAVAMPLFLMGWLLSKLL